MAQFSFSFCPDFRRTHRAPALLAACRQQASQQGTHRKHSREVPVWMPVRDNACSERKTKMLPPS